FSSRRRHTRFSRDWSSDVCSSDLYNPGHQRADRIRGLRPLLHPVVHALLIDVDEGRLRARIVVAEDLDEAAVARGARIGDDDAEIGRASCRERRGGGGGGGGMEEQ